MIDPGVETTTIKMLGNEETASGLVNLAVNAIWDGHGYRGNAIVDDTSIDVIVYKTSTGEWVNGKYTYGESIGWSLKEEVTLYFTYEDTSYKVMVHIVKKNESKPTRIANTIIELAPGVCE